MLRLEGVRASLSPLERVQELWLTLFCGEAVGLYGQYASAPGVVASLLLGAARLEQGRVWDVARGQELLGAEAALQSGIHGIHNENIFADSLTIGENLFVLRKNGLAAVLLRRRLLQSQTAALLQQVELAITPDTRVEKLTAPEKQMLELGKLLAGGARLVVFNLAFGEYTQKDLIRLQSVIARHKALGVSFVINSSHMEELRLLTDRVLFFKNDRLSKLQRTDRIRSQEVARFVAGPEISTETLSPPEGGPVVFSAGRFPWLPAGQLVLCSGEIVGLVCPTPALRGQVQDAFLYDRARLGMTLGGKPAGGGRHTPEGLALVPSLWHDATLYPNLSVTENLLLPSYKKAAGALGTLPRGLARFSSGEPQLAELVHRQSTDALTYAQKICLVFERWLVYRPQLMVITEPYLYSDPETQALINNYLRRLAALGCGVLLLSIRRQGLAGVCGRILDAEEAGV